MAIFGNLSDMPLPDVLSMVGRSTGRFQVWNLPSAHVYELHLTRGMLTALFVEQAAVEDVLHVRSGMIELLKAPEGDFEFERQPEELLQHFILVSIDQLMLSSLAAVDEITAYHDHLPSEKTVFETMGGVEAWLDDDLMAFWAASEPLLRQRSTGVSLAEHTGLSLEHVLLALYKLRSAGLIAPVRTWGAAQMPHRRMEMATAAPVERSTTRLPQVDAAPEPDPIPPVPSASGLQDVEPFEPPKGFLARLLARFTHTLNG